MFIICIGCVVDLLVMFPRMHLQIRAASFFLHLDEESLGARLNAGLEAEGFSEMPTKTRLLSNKRS
jgi:hypothetical protein